MKLAIFTSYLSNMKDDIPFDDLSLFMSVAEAGGLVGAVPVTGQSAPTLSRKMAALERQMERRLFSRGPQGYALTAEGRALLAELEPMRDMRVKLAKWLDTTPDTRVRVTAGTWTSRWLARGLSAYWTPSAGWLPEFTTSNAVLDIARREADIGFRNRRPEQPWLAGRRTRQIDYAEYAARRDVAGYVTLSEGLASTPSTRWVRTEHADEILTTVSEARLALDVALQGIGRIVLPTFIGDREDGLTRVSDTIEALTHDEWLVTHHDARHDPPIRAAIDAIVGFIEGQRA